MSSRNDVCCWALGFLRVIVDYEEVTPSFGHFDGKSERFSGAAVVLTGRPASMMPQAFEEPCLWEHERIWSLVRDPICLSCGCYGFCVVLQKSRMTSGELGN